MGPVAEPHDTAAVGLPIGFAARHLAGCRGMGRSCRLDAGGCYGSGSDASAKQRQTGGLALTPGALMSEPVITVKRLGKAYQLNSTPRSRLRALLTGRELDQQHWALRNIDFSLQRGQCLGLVGSNGAGKSTLLKLLASSLQPTTGTVHVAGRLTAILELGAGFHPEFTGRENLFFGGSLIGLNADEIRRLLPSIAAFSELSEALDRPVKTYSSGMVVRLAFALVTAVEPDVLIIDEALAVGDQHFQKKCIERINRFRDNGCTILFCSHSLYHIRNLCDVAIWIDKGASQALGPTEEVLAQYDAHLRSMEAASASTMAAEAKLTVNHEPVPIQGVHLAEGKAAEWVSFEAEGLVGDAIPLLTKPDLVVKLVARAKDGECPNFGVMLEQADGRGITAVTTQADGVRPRHCGGGVWQLTLTFTDLPLFSGEYVLSAYLFDSSGLIVYEEWLKHIYFSVRYPSSVPGLVRLPHRWA